MPSDFQCDIRSLVSRYGKMYVMDTIGCLILAQYEISFGNVNQPAMGTEGYYFYLDVMRVCSKYSELDRGLLVGGIEFVKGEMMDKLREMP